jgi:hypothetical protein
LAWEECALNHRTNPGRLSHLLRCIARRRNSAGDTTTITSVFAREDAISVG